MALTTSKEKLDDVQVPKLINRPVTYTVTNSMPGFGAGDGSAYDYPSEGQAFPTGQLTTNGE